MKFEVNKFLALTAALATAAAAAAGCSSTDKKDVEGSAGGGDTAGASGSADNGEAGESVGGDSAAAGAGTGEAGAGGVGEAGAGGATFECIAELAGAGGASDQAGPCDIWFGTTTPDCGDEATNFVGNLCYDIYSLARPAVLAAFNDCAAKLSDVCAEAGVYACAGSLVGKACVQETTAEACAFIESKCEEVTQCAGVLDLALPDSVPYLADCMDPTGESYDVTFEGSCDERLLHCAKLTIPPPPLR